MPCHHGQGSGGVPPGAGAGISDLRSLWDLYHSHPIFLFGHIAEQVFCSNVAKLQQAEEATYGMQ
jgi:hypothetical protein